MPLRLNLWIWAQLRLGSILGDPVINIGNAYVQIHLFFAWGTEPGRRMQADFVAVPHGWICCMSFKEWTERNMEQAFHTTYLCKVWIALHIWKHLATLCICEQLAFFSVVLLIWGLAMELGRVSIEADTVLSFVAGFLKHLYWSIWRSISSNNSNSFLTKFTFTELLLSS